MLLDSINPANTLVLKETKAAGQALGLKLQTLEVRGVIGLDKAFGLAKKNRAQAVHLLPSTLFLAQRSNIAALAAKSKLPAMYYDRLFAEAGGLVSYGSNLSDLYRRTAYYVDRILKGTKPADLPVEQPMKFEFIINLNAAKQIGVTIPQWTLMKADRVIR